jgi:hypothetical protein
MLLSSSQMTTRGLSDKVDRKSAQCWPESLGLDVTFHIRGLVPALGWR